MRLATRLTTTILTLALLLAAEAAAGLVTTPAGPAEVTVARAAAPIVVSRGGGASVAPAGSGVEAVLPGAPALATPVTAPALPAPVAPPESVASSESTTRPAAPAVEVPAHQGKTVVVSGTNGLGLAMRSTPGGTPLGVVPEGAELALTGEATTVDGRRWQLGRTPGGVVGWVATDYLTPGAHLGR